MSGGRGQSRLRIGIMCRGTTVPAWQAAAISELMEVDGVDIVLLIVDARRHRRSIAISSTLKDRRRLLWNLFNKGHVERRSRASRATAMPTELSEISALSVNPERVERYKERFDDSDIELIRGYELDVVLRFGFGILTGDILTTPRYGIWSFHHGDERSYRGRPPAFWELYEDQDVVGSVLQLLTERLDGGLILHRGFYKTTKHSYVRTRDTVLMGSAIWPSIVARQILSGDLAVLDQAASDTVAPVRRDPNNGTMLRFLFKQALAFVCSQWRGLTRAAKWSIGVAHIPMEQLVDTALPKVEWLRERTGSRYLADPFPHWIKDRLYALVEDYDYKTRKGVISAVDLDQEHVHPVLGLEVHASYPYILEFEGQVYCVPESHQAGEVRLYRASHFPDRWELIAVLLEGIAALDPTLFQHNGRWWLFCTDYADGPNTKLSVFHSAQLLSGWEPHLLNPVKTDIRSARPAGTPFLAGDGVLHRPAQDSSRSYGESISIMRVEELTPHRFNETVVARIGPEREGPFPDGIHTVSAAGPVTLVDGRRDRFVTAAFVNELQARIRRIVG